MLPNLSQSSGVHSISKIHSLFSQIFFILLVLTHSQDVFYSSRTRNLQSSNFTISSILARYSAWTSSCLGHVYRASRSSSFARRSWSGEQRPSDVSGRPHEQDKDRLCDGDLSLSLKGGYIVDAKTTVVSVWLGPPIILCRQITVRTSTEEACQTELGICKVNKDVDNISDKSS